MDTLNKDKLITLYYFNTRDKSIGYNPNITKLSVDALFVDDNGEIYRIV